MFAHNGNKRAVGRAMGWGKATNDELKRLGIEPGA
jgi:hypothetical protein